MTKKWLALLTASIVLTSSSCTTSGLRPSSSDSTTSGSSETGTTVTNAVTTQTSKSNLGLNMFTGEYDIASSESTRPIALMIGNNAQSRPQYGLEKADMYIEAETEGGITRIMAVFANVSRVPDQLGPIRSARTPFVYLSEALDTVYCHAGGSPKGLATITSTNIGHIDGCSYDGTTFWRDATLRKTKGLEYSMMTSGTKLLSRMSSLKLRNTTSRKSPFTFGSKSGSTAANNVEIFLSGTQTISFTYNTTEQRYYKINGSLASGFAHKAASGTQISSKNVIVMYDTKSLEAKDDEGLKDTYAFALSSGTGLVCSNGTSRSIKWSRSSFGLSFTETDGTSLTVAAGQSYICLVDTSYKSQTTVK